MQLINVELSSNILIEKVHNYIYAMLTYVCEQDHCKSTLQERHRGGQGGLTPPLRCSALRTFCSQINTIQLNQWLRSKYNKSQVSKFTCFKVH